MSRYINRDRKFLLSLLRPSIKYVTLFLANFYPPPPVTLRHTSRDPPESTSHISDPQFFEGLVQNPGQKPVLIVRGGFCPGVLPGGLFLEGFVSGGFCLFPFCQNTSVTSKS